MKRQRKRRRFSFSLLNLNCPRRIHKTMTRDRIEVFPAEETDEGRKIHTLLAEILSSEKRDFSKLTSSMKIYGDPEKTFSKTKGRYTTETKIRIFIGDKKFTTISDLLVTRRGERDIIDHKTSFSQDVLPSYREQLQYYALPFLRKGLKVKVGIHFVRYARLEWIEILQGLDDYARIANLLSEKIEKVENILKEKPKPEPSNFECKYCPYVISCPSSPEFTITKQEEAANLAGEYLKLRSMVKKAEELLRIWVSQKGILQVNGSRIGFFRSEKTVIDQEYTLKYLNHYNIPIAEIFSANTNKFRKLARQYEELANFAEIQISTRWGVTSADNEDD